MSWVPLGCVSDGQQKKSAGASRQAEVAMVLPLAASVAGEVVVGGEARMQRQARADWPDYDLLSLSAVLSRRFSSSTKGYISPKREPSLYLFSPLNCSPSTPRHRQRSFAVCSFPHAIEEPNT